jgi:hypothetical protein
MKAKELECKISAINDLEALFAVCAGFGSKCSAKRMGGQRPQLGKACLRTARSFERRFSFFDSEIRIAISAK